MVKINTTTGRGGDSGVPLLPNKTFDSSPVNAKTALMAAANVWDVVDLKNKQIHNRDKKLKEADWNSRIEYAHEQAQKAALEGDASNWQLNYEKAYEASMTELYMTYKDRPALLKEIKNASSVFKTRNITDVQNAVETQQRNALKGSVDNWAEEQRGLLSSGSKAAYSRSYGVLNTLNSKLEGLVEDGVMTQEEADSKYINLGRQLLLESSLARIEFGGLSGIKEVESMLSVGTELTNNLLTGDMRREISKELSTKKTALGDALDQAYDRRIRNITYSYDHSQGRGFGDALTSLEQTKQQFVDGATYNSDDRIRLIGRIASGAATEYAATDSEEAFNNRLKVMLNDPEIENDKEAQRIIKNIFQEERERKKKASAEHFQKVGREYIQNTLTSGDDPDFEELLTIIKESRNVNGEPMWHEHEGENAEARTAFDILDGYARTILESARGQDTLEKTGLIEKIDALISLKNQTGTNAFKAKYDISADAYPSFWNIESIGLQHDEWIYEQGKIKGSIKKQQAVAITNVLINGDPDEIAKLQNLTYEDKDGNTQKLLPDGDDLAHSLTPEMISQIDAYLQSGDISEADALKTSRELLKYGSDMVTNYYTEHISGLIDRGNIEAVLNEVASVRSVIGREPTQDEWVSFFKAPVNYPTNHTEAATYAALYYSDVISSREGAYVLSSWMKSGDGDELRRLNAYTDHVVFFAEILNNAHHEKGSNYTIPEKDKLDEFREAILKARGIDPTKPMTSDNTKYATWLGFQAVQLLTQVGQEAPTEKPTAEHMDLVISQLVAAIEMDESKNFQLSHDIDGFLVKQRSKTVIGSLHVDDIKANTNLDEGPSEKALINLGKVYESAGDANLDMPYLYKGTRSIAFPSANEWLRELSTNIGAGFTWYQDGTVTDYVIENYSGFRHAEAQKDDIFKTAASQGNFEADLNQKRWIVERDDDGRVVSSTMIAPLYNKEGAFEGAYLALEFDSSTNTFRPKNDNIGVNGIVSTENAWINEHQDMSLGEVGAWLISGGDIGPAGRIPAANKPVGTTYMKIDDALKHYQGRAKIEFAQTIFVDDNGDYDKELQFGDPPKPNEEALHNAILIMLARNGVELIDEEEGDVD